MIRPAAYDAPMPIRRRPLRTLLPVALVVAAALAATGVAAPATTAPRVLLPTIRCPLDTALDTVRTPKVAAREPATVPATLAPSLAVYVGGPERVVAPRGWRCSALAAVNGGTLLIVEPRGADRGEGIRSWRERACVGCIHSATCLFFAKEARALSVGIPCARRPAGLRVTRLAATLARYRYGDGETGLVLLDAETPEAAGVTCRASGAGVCSAVLADWRS